MSDVRIKSGTVNAFSFGTGNPAATTTTINGNSNPMYKVSPWSSFQATVTGTGAVTATVTIQGSNDDTTGAGVTQNWVTTVLGTITLTGTSPQSDGFTTVAPWKYVRAVVSNVTGTGATVQVLMGV